LGRGGFFQAQPGQGPDHNNRIAYPHQGGAFEPRGNKRRLVQNLPNFRGPPFGGPRRFYFHGSGYLLNTRVLRSQKSGAHNKQTSQNGLFHDGLLYMVIIFKTNTGPEPAVRPWRKPLRFTD
jgi:hypothetical protein